VVVVAVEIDAIGAVAGAGLEAGRIQAGADPEVGMAGEEVGSDEVKESERGGGFVAVDASGQVDAGVRGVGGMVGAGGDAKGAIGGGLEGVEGPTGAGGLESEGVEEGWDIEVLAEVTEVIDAETLHRE
jgi:hypothetical protein